MDGAYRPPAIRRLTLGAVGSTNSIAMEAARSGDPGPLWVTAERQTEGRGRRGRAWVSESGNLYASLILIDPAPLEAIGQLPLVIAVGLRRALASLPGLEPNLVQIKWPNDILIDGAKCVGILIESERLPTQRQAVVVGMGINVATAPGDAPYGVATLEGAGMRLPLDAVFDAVAASIERTLRQWDGGAGFKYIRQAWLDACVGLGRPIRVNLPDRSIEGVFDALDAQGHLILRHPSGKLEQISSGDVFLIGDDSAGAICDKAH